MFRLTKEESNDLISSGVSQSVIPSGYNTGGFGTFAFTEQGVAMLATVLNRLEDGTLQPKCGIFFNGQTFDAYVLVSDLIKSARKRVCLIDNYVDESVLTMLDKRSKGVAATIFTLRLSKQFKLDIQKHDSQYAPVSVKTFNDAHDRFLIIDDCVYHVGASFKDLGKKWFAIMKMESEDADKIVGKLDLSAS